MRIDFSSTISITINYFKMKSYCLYKLFKKNTHNLNRKIKNFWNTEGLSGCLQK